MTTTTADLDLSIENHGTIMLLTPCSDAGREWVDSHLPEDALTWGTSVVVEPRFIFDIAEGAIRDGLEVA